MKFTRSQQEIVASTANPTPEAMGFNVETELAAACRDALKPLSKKLRDYRSREQELKDNCLRWTEQAYRDKVSEITHAAAAGDEAAIEAIANGALPTKQGFLQMANAADAEVAGHLHAHRALFAEAAVAIVGPMNKVCDKGQARLDQLAADFGIPRFELTGGYNRVIHTREQLEAAARGETHDLGWFWDAMN